MNDSNINTPDVMPIIVSVQHVSKIYHLGKQTITALNDVSVEVRKGEFIALTGASGSGKSTLLQMIGCLDKPSNGQIFISGQDVTKLRDSRLSNLRQKAIGFVFQSFYLQPFLKLGENIAVPAMFKGEKIKTINERVALLLDQVGLGDRKTHYPKELSGGEIQRAAIARALMNNPQILLADEPTGNLDTKNSTAIIDLFREIQQKFGTTIIIVTHNPEIARQADRTITLKDGVIV